MGSDETKSTLDTERSTVPGSNTTTKSCWMTQVVLRIVLFAATLTSIVVMVTSKQTKNIFIPGTPIRIPAAEFSNSPALIYFVVALSVACLYSILSTLATVSAFKKPSSCSAILLVNLAIMDAVMVGILASATGAGGAVAYVGLNKEVRWGKICHKHKVVAISSLRRPFRSRVCMSLGLDINQSKAPFPAISPIPMKATATMQSIPPVTSPTSMYSSKFGMYPVRAHFAIARFALNILLIC